jgi:GWxTD domain-containing protein
MRLQLISIILTLFIQGAVAQMSILPLNADYATFRGSDSTTYVEVYISFFQDELAFQIEEDSSLTAHYMQRVTISENDSIISQSSRNYRNKISFEKRVSGFNHMMDIFAFELPPGKYDLTIEIEDEISKKSGKFVEEMHVPVYANEFSISDIELSTNIKKAESVTHFSNKNNMNIIPNPSSVFGLIYPVMFFYFEAYNLGVDDAGQSKYSYHYYITDQKGIIVRELSQNTKSRTNHIIAEASGSNVIALPEDTYQLNIQLIDQIAGDSLLATKSFRVRKKIVEEEKPAGIAQGDLKGEYAAYSEEELQNEFAQIKYIASPEEQNVFEELDVDGMRRFLVQFWNLRDPDPSTPQNEYKISFMENIKLADASYSTLFKIGWKTDRGRVLLVYGRPDEIERNPSVLDTNPFEIWYYYSLEGGCEFVFGDLSGHGEYELLHSTYRNELQDLNWRSRLSSGSGGYRIDY